MQITELYVEGAFMKTLISISNDTIMNTFFTKDNISLAHSLGETVFCGGRDSTLKEEFKRLISDCDLYVSCWGSPAIDGEILDCAKKLKLICHLGSTVAPIVQTDVWSRGVRVISAHDYFSESTAEGAIAYMLAALRNIPYYSERLKKDKIWSLEGDATDGLIYKTVGLVSYGGVGRHVAKKLSVFNVDLKVYDVVDIPEAEKEKYGLTQCGIEELFSTCDIISLHTPYNDKTHHMVNDRLLSMIKPGALFVNTARGGVVDQEALTSHLQKGHFTAALDVYEREPIDTDDPLLSLDNVLMLPHQGGVTTNLRRVLTKDLLTESRDFIDSGAPLKDEILPSYAKNMSKF